MSTKVYEIITNNIIDKLHQGVVPWQKPFVIGLPQNLISRKPYRGINIFLLPFDHSTPFWLTYKQAKKLGGNIKRGEKGSIITFWKMVEKKESPGKFYSLLRYYQVFNLDQTEGIENPEIPGKKENSPITCAENLISAMPNPPATCTGPQSCYIPTDDKVMMPPIGSFVDSESFYTTYFHELTHSTMHETRCNRKTNGHKFGSQDYSKEELTAELGACFLSGECGITGTFDNSASYIGGWLKKLQDDVKFIVMASAQAQKACDYIKNVKW